MSAVIAVVAISLAPKWRPRNGRPSIWKRIRPTTWRGPSGPRQPKKSRPRTEAGIIKGKASLGLCGSRCGFALPALRARGAARIRFRCRRFFLRLARRFGVDRLLHVATLDDRFGHARRQQPDGAQRVVVAGNHERSEEHTSELQSRRE